MKFLAILLSCLSSLNLFAQQTKPEFDGHTWEAPYTLPVPNGWAIERFTIPISFAPQIVYKGVEDIRFAPGWNKVTSEEYWSYAFMWYLDGDIKVDADLIENNLNAYYTGLIKINGANIPPGKIVPVVTSFKEVKKDRDDLKTFVGTIKMTDYMEQKPIMLNCKVHVKSCMVETKTFIFYELSPQPFSHNIWKSLDKLWEDFRCQKS